MIPTMIVTCMILNPVGIITFIIAVWSSRNPNTFKFLGNAAPAPEEVGEDDDI